MVIELRLLVAGCWLLAAGCWFGALSNGQLPATSNCREQPIANTTTSQS
jgi:hypothetical protein